MDRPGRDDAAAAKRIVRGRGDAFRPRRRRSSRDAQRRPRKRPQVHQWPENAVSRVVNATGDKCHVVVEPDFARDNIRHAAGSGEKRGAALRSRLEEFAEETSCF